MNTLTIKKYTLFKFLGLIFSVAYGFFAIAYLNNHYVLDSGDVVNLVANVDGYKSSEDILVTFDFSGAIPNGDAIFYILILGLNNLLNMSSQDLLGGLAFLISSITFFIFSINIRQRKYLFFVALLFLMVFLTPRVINLFASSIRSGIASTILIIAFMYLRGIKQYILFFLSTLIHLSMAPMIALYFLYNWIEGRRINLSFTLSLFVLLLSAFFMAALAPMLSFTNPSAVSQSLLYMVLVTCIALLMIFTNKKVIRNVYGFISIGLILIVLLGYIFEFSFVRYIGNAIIFYLLFIIKEGGPRTIRIFTIGYTPFFLLTLYYSIANYW